MDKISGLFLGSTLRYYNNCNDILDVWIFESDVSMNDVIIQKEKVKDVKVKIDRPFGSKHPKKDFIYPVNYGYIPNTTSGDGEEIDAYVLGVFEPIEEFDGKVIAVIHRTNDNDDKLIVTKNGVNYSYDAIRAITEFQEKYFDSIIIR